MRAAATLLAALVLSSCATIVHGRNQNLLINGYPAGSEATIDGTLRVITPGVVKLERGREHDVLIEREGFASYHEHIGQSLSGWFLGNIFLTPLGFVVGALIDWSDGAMWNLEADQVAVSLRQTAPAGAAPACAIPAK